MADSKISDLTAGTVAAVDEFPFVQSGTTKVDTIQGIIDLVPASANLGTSDLTSTANERIFALNGATSTNKLTIENSAGTDIAQFRGDLGSYFYGDVFYNTGTATTTTLTGSSTAKLTLVAGASTSYFQQNSSGSNNAYFSGAINWKMGASLALQFNTSGLYFYDGFNIDCGSTTGTKFAPSSTRKMGFWGTTPRTQPAALTAQLTDITGDITPATPDYVVTATSGGWGFGSQDEFETAMNVINNLQTRVQELEDALSTAAGGSGLIA